MQTITEINNDAKQKLSLVTEDGVTFDFTIEYKPNVLGWFFSLTYEDFTVNNVRLCNFPNLLRQWKNKLPFGIMCTVNDGSEPFLIDDFATDRVQIHLLTTTEVELVESELFNG